MPRSICAAVIWGGGVVAPPKPRRSTGYSTAQTTQVVSACLTVVVTLGALMDDLCIIGGLVPTLLIDYQFGPDHQTGTGHVGTNDLDIGLAVGLLESRQYSQISERLRQEGFRPDQNDRGNPTPQRWRLRDLNVTVDFLMPPIPGATRGGREHNLQGDFAALIAPGLELAFRERVLIPVNGHTFAGEKVQRPIPVCGPAAFTVLKAFAFGERGEPKDAYDLTYILRRWPHGIQNIASALARHASAHPEIVTNALTRLASDFARPDSLGPLRAAAFEGDIAEDPDIAAADSHGYVDDLLRACRKLDGIEGMPDSA